MFPLRLRRSSTQDKLLGASEGSFQKRILIRVFLGDDLKTLQTFLRRELES